VTFDRDGRKTSERIVEPPVPGYNVVTTLDLRLQEMAEKALAAKANGARIVDPNSIRMERYNPMAMASMAERLTLTNSLRPFRPPSSRSCKMTPIFRSCRALIAPLIRRGRPSRWRSASQHSRAARSPRRTNYECVPEMDVGNTTFHN